LVTIVLFGGVTVVRIDNLKDKERPVEQGQTSTLKFELSYPSFDDVVASLPEELRTDEVKKSLEPYYRKELENMLFYGRGYANVKARMGLFDVSPHSDQCILGFRVDNLDAAYDPKIINWHGQNQSQWLYGGAIVVDKRNGHVSSHH
jgi:hypothetical protein